MALFKKPGVPNRASNPARRPASSAEEWMPKVGSPASNSEKQAKFNSEAAKKRTQGSAAWESKYGNTTSVKKQDNNFGSTTGYNGRTGTDSEQRM